MTQTTVLCDVVSAEKEIFSAQIEFLSATGGLGDLGITPGHAPLLSSLKPGPLELRLPGGETQIFFISGGYLEVQNHHIIVLADTALRADDLDEAAAEEARQSAQRDLQDVNSEMDFAKGAAQLAEAAARLRTLKQLREKKR